MLGVPGCAGEHIAQRVACIQVGGHWARREATWQKSQDKSLLVCGVLGLCISILTVLWVMPTAGWGVR